MEDCKAYPCPFLSGIRLEEGGSTPLVESTLYRQLIGILLYLTHSRPNISYVVSVAARYMQDPHELHWKATKRTLHYVQGTRDYGIHYAGVQIDLIGFTDSDWARMGMIENPLQDLCLCWDMGQFVGPVRSKQHLHSLQHKQRIGGL